MSEIPDQVASRAEAIRLGLDSVYSRERLAEGVSRASLNRSLSDVIATLHNVIAEQNERIKALEAGHVSGTKWMGVYQRAVSYLPGHLVTFGGALWHCSTEATGVQPGTAAATWQLCAKSGESVPRSQKEMAGQKVGSLPRQPKIPRTYEKTRVTRWTDDGRIAEFIKEQVIE